MRRLSGGRRLKPLDLAALGVHAADHMPADAVLAGGVQPLQHDQERVPVIAIHLALERAELGLDGLQFLFRSLGGVALAMTGRIELLQPDLGPWLNNQILGVVHLVCTPEIGWLRDTWL